MELVFEVYENKVVGLELGVLGGVEIWRRNPSPSGERRIVPLFPLKGAAPDEKIIQVVNNLADILGLGFEGI